MANRNGFTFEGVEYEMSGLLLSEARAIQKVTGMTIAEWETALEAGDANAITAIIWVAQKRKDPTLRFDDVDGNLATFGPIVDPDEPETEPGKAGDGEPVVSTAGPYPVEG